MNSIFLPGLATLTHLNKLYKSPDTPVVELPDGEAVTIPEVSGVGERETEKLQEIDNWELYIYYMYF